MLPIAGSQAAKASQPGPKPAFNQLPTLALLPPTPQILSTLFSAATRLRRIFLLLPQALAQAQPDCSAAVAAHFSCHERTWELSAPAAVDAVEAEDLEKDALELLRSKLPALATVPAPSRPPVRTASVPSQPEGGVRAAAASKLQASVPARLQAGWMGFLEALNRRTGVTSHHLALATQVRAAALRCALHAVLR